MNRMFSDDLRGNKSLLIHLNYLNIRSKIWRRPFNDENNLIYNSLKTI